MKNRVPATPWPSRRLALKLVVASLVVVATAGGAFIVNLLIQGPATLTTTTPSSSSEPIEQWCDQYHRYITEFDMAVVFLDERPPARPEAQRAALRRLSEAAPKAQLSEDVLIVGLEVREADQLPAWVPAAERTEQWLLPNCGFMLYGGTPSSKSTEPGVTVSITPDTDPSRR